MIGEMLQSSILERIALQVLANAVGAHSSVLTLNLYM